jgi:hypothetical protein
MKHLNGEATEKQKKTMEKLGINFRKNITKQLASDKISLSFNEIKSSNNFGMHNQYHEDDYEFIGLDDLFNDICPNGTF